MQPEDKALAELDRQIEMLFDASISISAVPPLGRYHAHTSSRAMYWSERWEKQKDDPAYRARKREAAKRRRDRQRSSNQ